MLSLYKSYCQKSILYLKHFLWSRGTVYVFVYIMLKKWNQDRSFGKTTRWNKNTLKGEFKYLNQNILQALGDCSHPLWESYKSSRSRESLTICLNVLGKTRKLKQRWGSQQWAVLPLACVFIANESKRRDWEGYCPCQMQSIHCSGNLLCFNAHFLPVIFFS